MLKFIIILFVSIGVYGGLLSLDEVSASTTTSTIQCFNADVGYNSGSRVPSLRLSSGSELSLPGFEYVCRGGRWTFERVGTQSATSTELIGTQVPRCQSGTDSYPEGTRRNSITVNGVSSVIMDASYVCRNGQWRIEGSFVPVTGSTTATTSVNAYLNCYRGEATYKHGDRYEVPTTGVFGELPAIFDRNPRVFWCTNGEWTTISPNTACVLGATTYPAGSIISRPRNTMEYIRAYGFSVNPAFRPIISWDGQGTQEYECLAGEFKIKMRASDAQCKVGTTIYQHGQLRPGYTTGFERITGFTSSGGLLTARLPRAWCHRGVFTKERDGTPFEDMQDREDRRLY